MFIDDAFKALSDLRLWYNDRAGDTLLLSDIPAIIPLRWPYFRDNWEFLKTTLESRISTYRDPDQLEQQLESFSEFIRIQRNNQNKQINPFSVSNILNKFYAIWDSLEVSSIPITADEQRKLDAEVKRVRRFTKTDFLDIRSRLVRARDEIADITGGTDEDYNTTYHRSARVASRSIKISDVSDMQQLMNGVKSVDFILANINFLNTTTVDPFALARSNANNPDFNIDAYASGTLIRMLYGDSLQTLASRYLGDPDKWIDIAIANGLKPPYIDEIGEAIPLISNGSGNQINISRLDVNGEQNKDKIYINQVVFLQSDTIKFPDQRSIINIKEVPVSGELIIELSGEGDLNKLQIDENAYMRVFAPNTVNSNFFVLIPSINPPDNAPIGTTPFFLKSKSEDEKQAGVDFALDSNLDLVLTSFGDLQLSFGLANAIQAVQLKMLSEKGQSPRHPDYGLPAVQGKRLNDPEELRQALVTAVNEMINADSRFDRIEELSVQLSREGATAYTIRMVVRLAGGSGTLVPISFTVNTG